MSHDLRNGYRATIGLEIHAQLNTETKLFSRSLNNPEEVEPNVNVSPIDAAHPGTLPALNYQAVKKVIQVGLAIGGNIANYTEWDRKNFFYPDIPKAYQISQYKYPLVTGGSIAGFELTRIHLEEDTGKSMHLNSGQAGREGGYSLVNLNRAGTPLMELVTEPVLHTSQDAVIFAKEFQLLLRFLGVGEANLEKGEMRIEANISVSKTDDFGTKVEVKNLNSFKSVEKAIEYEIDRHIKVNESGGIIIQETRGWDENKEVTFSQRAKEDAHDYRYFPDPDIPKLYVEEVFDLEAMRSELPELPSQRRSILRSDGLSKQQIEFLLSDNSLYDRYNYLKSNLDIVEAKKIANVLTTNLAGLDSSDKEGSIDNISNTNLLDLLDLQQKNELSSSGFDAVLETLYIAPQSDVAAVVDDLGVRQNNDEGAILEIAKQVIKDNADAVDEYKSGKEVAIKYLMGQGMKLSRGSANPQQLQKVIQTLLK